MTKPAWDERIRRAEELAKTYSFAYEVLHFYKQITELQKDLYLHLESVCGDQVRPEPAATGRRVEWKSVGSLRDELDLFVLLPRFAPFLSLVERAGPPPLATSARELYEQGPCQWGELLAGFWTAAEPSDPALGPTQVFFARAILQPYAEYLADHTGHAPASGAPRICPLCQGKPQVGVLRQEGDGAKRSLVCALCSIEWDYRRILCPGCGEESVDKLAVYTANEFPQVRVEACDTCRQYIKTVDLTKNGLAVPVVDELATIPLNLWAEEKGYRKLELNLVGI